MIKNNVILSPNKTLKHYWRKKENLSKKRKNYPKSLLKKEKTF